MRKTKRSPEGDLSVALTDVRLRADTADLDTAPHGATFIYAALARSVKQKRRPCREEHRERCANDTKKPHGGALAASKIRRGENLAKELPYRRPLMVWSACPGSFAASKEMTTQDQTGNRWWEDRWPRRELPATTNG